jgi:hypothetical protein
VHQHVIDEQQVGRVDIDLDGGHANRGVVGMNDDLRDRHASSARVEHPITCAHLSRLAKHLQLGQPHQRAREDRRDASGREPELGDRTPFLAHRLHDRLVERWKRGACAGRQRGVEHGHRRIAALEAVGRDRTGGCEDEPELAIDPLGGEDGRGGRVRRGKRVVDLMHTEREPPVVLARAHRDRIAGPAARHGRKQLERKAQARRRAAEQPGIELDHDGAITIDRDHTAVIARMLGEHELDRVDIVRKRAGRRDIERRIDATAVAARPDPRQVRTRFGDGPQGR